MSKAIKLTIWCAVIALCLGALSYAISNRGSFPELFEEFDFTIGSGESDYVQDLSASDVDNMKIDALYFDVEILFENRSDVSVTVYTGKKEKEHVTMSQSGGTVMLSAPGTKKLFFNFFNVTRNRRIVVVLPVDSNIDMNINSTSGDIYQKNDGVFRELKIKTLVGDVDLNHTSADKINIQTASGDIDAQSIISSDAAEISSTSGDIEISLISAELDVILRSASGDLDIDEISANGKIDVHTISGEIGFGKIYAEDGATLKTTSGDVKTTEIVTLGKVEIITVSGEIGMQDLSGEDILVSSVSGSLMLKNVIGKGKFSTTSGEITIYANEVTGDITVSSVSGEILIWMPKNTDIGVSMKSTSGGCSSDFGSNGFYSLGAKTTSGSIRIKAK